MGLARLFLVLYSELEMCVENVSSILVVVWGDIVHEEAGFGTVLPYFAHYSLGPLSVLLEELC